MALRNPAPARRVSEEKSKAFSNGNEQVGCRMRVHNERQMRRHSAVFFKIPTERGSPAQNITSKLFGENHRHLPNSVLILQAFFVSEERQGNSHKLKD